MKQRYSVFPRPWGVYYYQDNTTGKQGTLKTRDKDEAYRLVAAKNESEAVPAFSRHLAQVYWKAGDPEAAKRTWQAVMNEIPKLKTDETQLRWLTAIKDKAFDSIRELPLLETQAEHLLRVLENGSVSTNVYLRRIHNFAVDMNWLPWPVIPKKRWPAVIFKDKRAITLQEHQAIVARERNPEYKAFYQLAWHLGASQSDLAHLQAEDVNWPARVICFVRMKLRRRSLVPPQIRFGDEVAEILRSLPETGPLFPRLRLTHEKHRAKEFKRRCVGLGIHGVTLHSYRYAWAERAKKAAYPERYAQINLGHNSKAWSRAYSKKADVTLPSLEEYEQKMEQKIVPLPTQPRTETIFKQAQAVNA